jgi:hypothetical protein
MQLHPLVTYLGATDSKDPRSADNEYSMTRNGKKNATTLIPKYIPNTHC